MRLQSITNFIILCGVPACIAGKAHVRGLREDRRQLISSSSSSNNNRRTQYRNPCTGSWSNDKSVLDNDKCEENMETGENNLVISTGGEGASEDDESRFGVEDFEIPASLDCKIKIRDDPMSPRIVRKVEYWYCVETNTTANTAKWLPVLENKIYDYSREVLMWCLGYPVPDKSRRLGVFSVSSDPKDKVRSDVKSPNCKDGHVVQGALSIEAREVDNLNNTIEAILYDMEEKMRKDTLLGKDIPKVTDVTYLGRSQEEVENPSQVPGVAGIVNNSKQENEKDDKNTFLVAGLCSAALLLLLLLLLLVYRKKKNDEKNSKDKFLAIVENPSDFASLPGTGDPPGSFHHGVYHYMRDGQNYLSTNCFECHETKTLSNSDFGNVLPSPMTASNVYDDPYYDTVVTPQSKRFGSDQTGSNVHKCTSSTCQICLPDSKTTTMIKVNERSSKRILPTSFMDDTMGVANSTYEL